MSKYYTPEIEEFHVGFEYEFHGMTTGGLEIVDFSKNPIESKTISKPTNKVWTKESIYRDDCALYNRSFKSLEGLIKSKQIRVKHLDKEDIEILGFSMRTTSYGVYYIKNQYKIDYAWDKRLIISENNKMVVDKDFENQGNILFIGIIKNKSELKRILKQLNIL